MQIQAAVRVKSTERAPAATVDGFVHDNAVSFFREWQSSLEPLHMPQGAFRDLLMATVPKLIKDMGKSLGRPERIRSTVENSTIFALFQQAPDQAQMRHVARALSMLCEQIIANIDSAELLTPSVTGGMEYWKSSFLLHGTCRGLGLDGNVPTAEQAQRDQVRSGFEAMVRANGDAVWLWTYEVATGNVTREDGLAQRCGYVHTSEGVDAHWWMDRLHPEDQGRVISSLTTAATSGQLFWSSEYRLRCMDGSYMEMLDRAYIVHDGSGHATWVIGATTESLAQKRKGTSMQKATDRLRDFTDALPNHVGFIDTQERYRFANKIHREWLGYNLGQVEGRFLDEIFPAEAYEALKVRLAAAQAGEEVHFEMTLANVHGVQQSFVANIVAATNDEGEVHGLIFSMTPRLVSNDDGAQSDFAIREHRDKLLLDLARIHAENSENKDKVLTLEEESELREKFIAALAHDVRSPLSAIRMGAESIQRNPSRAEAVSSRVIRGVDRMDRMVADLLDVTRLRSGHAIALKCQATDLVAMTQDLLEDLAFQHGERFDFMTHHKTLQMHCDPDNLRRMLENLSTNAIKYGHVEGRVTVTLETVDGELCLAVHNTGNAIPNEELMSLFEPFRRAASAEASRQQGWGLGLAIVHGIATAHGGHISVESSEDSGTEFRVMLPYGEDGRGPRADAS